MDLYFKADDSLSSYTVTSYIKKLDIDTVFGLFLTHIISIMAFMQGC